MKYVFYAILILISFQLPIFADENTIWNLKNNDFWQKVETDDKTFLKEKQKKIDTSLEVQFDYRLSNINLEEALEYAMGNNYNIRIYTRKQRLSDLEFKEKLSKFLPDFNYSLNVSWLKGEFLVGGIVPLRISEEPISSSLIFSWKGREKYQALFDSFSYKKRFKAAKANLNYTKEETILNTVITYYDLLYQKLAIEIYRINLVETKEQYKYTKALYEVGMGAKFDLLRAEVQVAQAQQQLIEAQKALRLTQAKLANIIGIDVLTPLYPVEVYVESTKLIDECYTPEELFNFAIKARKDLIAKREEIKALRIDRNSIYSDFLPAADFTYSRNWVGTKRVGVRPNDTFMINIVAPLGKNLGVNSLMNIKIYNEKIKIAELELQHMGNLAKESIIKSFYDSQVNNQNILTTKKGVESADEALRNAMARMAAGQQTFLDVIAAQNSKTQSRINFINSIINYNKSQVQLLFDSGLLTTNAVLKNYKTYQP